MTFQSARLDLRSNSPHPRAHPLGPERMNQNDKINPFIPTRVDRKRRLSWPIQVCCTAVGACAFFWGFGEDAARQNNRRFIRFNDTQLIEEIIFLQHLLSPLPWESAHFSQPRTPES